MTYKGYMARIEFDERDNIFVGKVIGIADSYLGFFIEFGEVLLYNPEDKSCRT